MVTTIVCPHTRRDEIRALITHMQNDSFLQQALLFGSHHKVVSVILVVDNVFQVDACKVQEIDVLSHTNTNVSLIAPTGCHVVIRGTIMRLGARSQSRGTSACQR